MYEFYIEGDIAQDNDMWVYRWFGEKATSPNVVRAELEKAGGQDVTIWIDSPGGSLFAGTRMYTDLMSYAGKKTVHVSGLAASAASVIAMAGDEILMSPTAQLMIHNVHVEIAGDYRDADNAGQMLREANESIINAYERKTGKTREQLQAMMDAETFMSADKAISEGFADGKLFNAALAASLSERATGRVAQLREKFEAERAAALLAIEKIR